MEKRTHRIALPNTGSEGKHELVFYDWGDVNALTTTICVHGLTRNAHDFDLLAEALAIRGRRVLSINMAGRGESPWLKDSLGYHYGTYMADCLALMDNFHLRGVEWVGTSMGGIIGMMIASSQPSRIKKLVLNDIGTFLSKDALNRIYSYVRTMPRSFPSRSVVNDYLNEIFASFGITDPAQWEQFVDHSIITEGDTVRLACDPNIADALALATKNYTEIQDVNLSAYWEKIQIPTLILRGESSDVLDVETVSAMRATNPKAESVTIAGAGHAPSLMDNYQIQLVSQWLAVGGGTLAGL